MMILSRPTWCVLLLFSTLPALQAADPHLDAFSNQVKPFLEKRCLFCHNPDNKNGDLNLKALQEPAVALAERNRWEDVLHRLRTGDMPPQGMPRPKEEELLAVSRWMERQIEIRDKQTRPDPGRVTARRLNKVEYNNTIRDLFGVNLFVADDFPNDDSGYGFDNIGDVLSLSPVLLEKYLQAAEKVSAVVLPSSRFGKPVAQRYAYDQGRPDASPGSMVKTIRFEYWAEYEIVVRNNDRRPAGTAKEPLPPAPSQRLALFMDDQWLATEVVQQDIQKNRFVRKRLAIPPGDHHFRAAFVDENNQPVSPSHPDFQPILIRGKREDLPLFIDYIEVRGPYAAELGAAPAEKRLLVCAEQTPQCARQIVANLLPKAWRRPVSTAEVDRITSFATRSLAKGESFARSLRLSLQAMLVSPHFLFRMERDVKPEDAGKVHRLSAYELATRLSYFLWSSMPDDELFRAAADGRLLKTPELRAQVQRMLKDPKSSALVDNFAGQWLQLRNLEVHKPDPEKFPAYDAALREAMLTETRLLFANILRENRPVTEFLDSNYTYLNERLAAHYGIPGVKGNQFRRVELADGRRGGLLTHGSVLTLSSYPTRTSPVLRGKWIMENILGTPPPPPPPNVPELKTEEVGKTATLREQLEKHRANASCAVCHNKMDNLGFGLENYDAIGSWREADGPLPVDSTGRLPGNKTFRTPAEFKQLLRQEPEGFARALTAKLLTYALGRGLEPFDRATVTQICHTVAKQQYQMGDLVLAITESLPFQYRRGDARK